MLSEERGKVQAGIGESTADIEKKQRDIAQIQQTIEAAALQEEQARDEMEGLAEQRRH